MRSIIVTEFLSLDGVMEDPGGSEKTKYGGWSFQFFSDDMGRYKQAELLAADALLRAGDLPGFRGGVAFRDR